MLLLDLFRLYNFDAVNAYIRIEATINNKIYIHTIKSIYDAGEFISYYGNVPILKIEAYYEDSIDDCIISVSVVREEKYIYENK